MNETETLARFVTEARRNDIPLETRHEARRALLNWLGCALGGCRDETVERALQAVAPFIGPPGASLIGRSERADPLNAALVNALSSNILDYDDTHMPTVIHPTVPVAAAACAVAEHRGASGAAFLDAFILGVEVECRVGNAVSPGHYAAGWHITSTCGVLGAAAARVRIVLKDGRTLDRYVPHALGSLEKPMSDRNLEDKFRALAAGTSCDAEQLIRLVWSLDELENAGTLTRAASRPHPNRSSSGRRAASRSIRSGA